MDFGLGNVGCINRPLGSCLGIAHEERFEDKRMTTWKLFLILIIYNGLQLVPSHKYACSPYLGLSINNAPLPPSEHQLGRRVRKVVFKCMNAFRPSALVQLELIFG
jgi:hypothetical protein